MSGFNYCINFDHEGSEASKGVSSFRSLKPVKSIDQIDEEWPSPASLAFVSL